MIKEMNIMLDAGAYMPKRAHDADAGLDLFSPEDVIVNRYEKSVTIDTGVHVQIPEGYAGFLKSKSGLNVNFGITGEGVIDSGYTGSIVCKLCFNEEHETIKIKAGQKIIQLVILPIETPKLKLVTEFEDTERGNGGFGSTGI